MAGGYHLKIRKISRGQNSQADPVDRMRPGRVELRYSDIRPPCLADLQELVGRGRITESSDDTQREIG